MQTSTQKESKSGKKVTFEFFAPEARKVQVAGSFNDWNPESATLKRAKDGKWRKTLTLAAGRYEYRFLVDGNWQNDQQSVECTPNDFGSWNCVLEIQ